MKVNPAGLIAMAVTALILGGCQETSQMSLTATRATNECLANAKCVLLALETETWKKPSVDKDTVSGYSGETIAFFWTDARKHGKVKLKFPNGSPFTKGGKSIKLSHLRKKELVLKAVTEETSFKYTVKDSKHGKRPELDPVIIIHKPPL